jgi:hypothetical protein
VTGTAPPRRAARPTAAAAAVLLMALHAPISIGTYASAGDRASGVTADPPVYRADVVPASLQLEFTRKNFTRDLESGNFLGPKVYAKTLREPLVPLLINGKYARDLRGQTVFLRQTVRDKLLAADAAMFKKQREHILVNYGFRSNTLQYDLYVKLSGKGKVAPPGMSFHETGMAIDVANWRDAQRFMIEAGFVGGCYGIEEDYVHYSINELTKSSNATAFRRCTLKEIPEQMFKGLKKVGSVVTAGRIKK